MDTYIITEAGKQIERALEQGYETAAFNLYVDAFENDIELVMGKGSAEWHREIQRRIRLEDAVEREDAANTPYKRDARGRAIG
jgi:hypothetical protein